MTQMPDFRAWQPPMIEHMAQHPRCAVFASMGSGKTLGTYTAIANNDLLGLGPTLVLAPRRVALGTWVEEARKWPHLKHLRVSPAIGSADERRAALRRDADVYTINYDNLPWLLKHLGKAWPYDTVVADELTRLKSYRTQQGGARARALAQVAHSRVERFIGLTGTPAPNGYQDLWGQMWFIDRGAALGRSYDAYMQRWFRLKHGSDSMHRQYELMPHAEVEINDRIKHLCVTISPTDYGLKIDEPIVRTVEVDLPGGVRSKYHDMERDFFMEIGASEVEAANAGVKSIKLLQMASGAVYTDELKNWALLHDEKIDALKSIVEEANGMPVLVAYHWKHDLERLKKAFPLGRELDAKQSTIDAWNRGEIPVMFAHPESAGHGLNLQDGGNIIVYFSFWWGLEAHEQILERIGPLRQFQAGHNRPVYVYFIVARNTVDEDVVFRHKSKQSVQQVLLDAMKRRME